jgi:hypothetical protein
LRRYAFNAKLKQKAEMSIRFFIKMEGKCS